MDDGRSIDTPTRWTLAVLVFALAAGAGALLIPGGRPPALREFEIVARQYHYAPYRIAVSRGDTVRLRLASGDVVHGFYLEGHDIDAMVVPGETGFRSRSHAGDPPYAPVEDLTFVTDRPGKYRYRCSITCGTLHPFMQGELVVRPNRTYGAGVGAAGGLFLASLLLLSTSAGPRRKRPWRLDLLRVVPGLRWFVTRRWYSFALLAPCLVILFFFILAGLWGSPIGNRNIVITIVWIFWWFLLITFFVPVGGRVWCMICPVPSVGEWLARGRLIGAGKPTPGDGGFRPRGLNRRWPGRLRNLWIQNLLFLFVCSISTILVTRPALTAFVLLGLFLAATAAHLVWRNRSFCSFLCPLNSWMSLYAMTAMTEVRPRDRGLRASCRGRECVVGTDDSWGCPWFLNPGKLDRNNYCGLCMECIKSCPNSNMTLNARPFCSDTRIDRLDETWMAFIMTVLALAYSVAFLGPWGEVKLWTDVTEFGQWREYFLYTLLIWAAALAGMPALWLGCTWLGRRLAGGRGPGVRELFRRSSYMLVPLGLMAWMAFSFPLIMVNVTHVTTTLSDPLGWGWDLFGTAHDRWTPLWPEHMIRIQIPLLLAGLGYAVVRGHGIALELVGSPGRATLSLLPHGLLCTAITMAFIRLFAG